MKRWMPAALASLLLCIGFGLALTVYLQPMEEKLYDLSLFWEGEAMPENWVYDQKGWTVFTQQGEQVNELTPNGFGSFSGLSFPEQTFYFSRVMKENLARPTLRLELASSTVSVRVFGRHAHLYRLPGAGQPDWLFAASQSELLPGGAAAGHPAPELCRQNPDHRPVCRPGNRNRSDCNPLRRNPVLRVHL